MKGKKWAKRAAFGAGALLAVFGTTVFTGLQMADHKMKREVLVQVKAVPWRTDAGAVERGRYLYNSRGCVDCHGANAAGAEFVNDGKGMRVAGPNISPGPGSVVAGYTPEDWDRAIRHGVGRQGRPLLIMPSEDMNRLTDDDFSSLVAYLRTMPPAPGGPAVLELPVPVRVLYGFGVIPDAASRIDHNLPPALPVAEGVTVAHGAYVANMCIGCHGEKLAGGKVPGGPPDWPPAADLRGGSPAMARYADADGFVRLFKTGKRPDGSEVKVMPFGSLKEMSDTDVRALFLYLKGLPAGSKG